MIKGNVELDGFVVRWPVITQNLLLSAEIPCSRLCVVTVCSSIWADAGSSLTQTHRAAPCLHQLPSRCCHQLCTFLSQKGLMCSKETQEFMDKVHMGHSCLFRAQAPSDAAVGFHTRDLSNLTIKILAPALLRLVSIDECMDTMHVCMYAAGLSFPLGPRRAAGPTVQTSDLNKCPERRLENWHSHAHNSELLPGRRQAMSVGFSLCCLIKTREQGMWASAALHAGLCTPSAPFWAGSSGMPKPTSPVTLPWAVTRLWLFSRTRHLADLFHNLIMTRKWLLWLFPFVMQLARKAQHSTWTEKGMMKGNISP